MDNLATIERSLVTEPGNKASRALWERERARLGLPALRWFHYRQNNSGGSFYGPENVIVQAVTAEAANERGAVLAGLYFDGVADGQDCGCCGDRWYRAWEKDEGDAFPSVYEEPTEAGEETLLVYADGWKEGGETK
tara:strand:- start:193 stop:600 length:408 start_codon:yes stop_codon:yes gene_type:complete